MGRVRVGIGHFLVCRLGGRGFLGLVAVVKMAAGGDANDGRNAVVGSINDI